MINITQPDIHRSVDAAVRLVGSVPKQLRYAASVAVNQALQLGQQAERARMRQVFDRPTPYVVRGGVVATSSTKTSLVGTLAVATANPGSGNVPAGKPLLAEVQGGVRRAKRSEILLQRAGLLPAGWLTVPGRGARLDAHGNIARGQLLEVLAWFRTFGATARSGKVLRSNITDAGVARKRTGTRNRVGLEYFAVPVGKKSALKPGIYARQVAGRFMGPVGQRPRAVLLFVPRAQYPQRLDFAHQAEQAIAQAFPALFAAAYHRAMSTAR